ncbi:MAG: carbohydrate ABC transporter permease [Rhodospirillales bacterium]|nr:carbohydrate ABC transporter permease [Rhodospirillales bacterium]MDE0378342.1 carbohydrate ABC transporter permease [Rhodospirillales bacterium]
MARRRRTRILTRAVLIVWTAVVVLPLLWMFSTAFKTQGAIFPTPKYIPWLQFEPTLDAFRTVLTQYRSQLVNAFENSVISASASAVAATILGALAGYALTRFRFRFGPLKNDDIAFFFISQRMLPPVVIIFPFLMMYRFLGLLDNPWSLALAYTLFNLPLAVWIMRDAFRAVPVEIEESALVDGCSRLSVFWKVALPLAAPGLVASFIICLIFAWNEFLFALVLTFRRSQTLPVMIAGQATELGSYWWIMATLAMIAVVPMILVGLAAQRWIVRGLSAGSVKG